VFYFGYHTNVVETKHMCLIWLGLDIIYLSESCYPHLNIWRKWLVLIFFWVGT
jgi:hypothetical protein